MEDPVISGAPGGASAIPPSPEPSQAPTWPGAVATTVPSTDAGDAPASIASQAKQKLTGALDGQKNVAADAVEKLAQNVQRSGEQFQGQQDWIASAIGRGAEELKAVAASLRDMDLGEALNGVQDFARRRPTLFLGAALATGFAVARLGKVAAADLSRDDLPRMPEVSHGTA